MEQKLQFPDVFSEPEGARVIELNIPSVSQEKDAFENLYHTLYLSVYHFARTFVDAEDAEDITANSFLKLWRSDLDYSIVPKVKTWLNVCTRNACLDLIRNRKKDTIKMAGFQHFLSTHSETEYENEIKEKLIERLYIEMEKLPEKCKRVFKMAYLEKQSSRKIATALSISENTVTAHRVKSLKLLRLAFQNYKWLLIIVSMFTPSFSALSAILP